jgi:hypothetical protein
MGKPNLPKRSSEGLLYLREKGSAVFAILVWPESRFSPISLSIIWVSPKIDFSVRVRGPCDPVFPVVLVHVYGELPSKQLENFRPTLVFLAWTVCGHPALRAGPEHLKSLNFGVRPPKVEFLGTHVSACRAVLVCCWPESKALNPQFLSENIFLGPSSGGQAGGRWIASGHLGRSLLVQCDLAGTGNNGFGRGVEPCGGVFSKLQIPNYVFGPGYIFRPNRPRKGVMAPSSWPLLEFGPNWGLEANFDLKSGLYPPPRLSHPPGGVRWIGPEE